MDISVNTKKMAVIGDPIAHSLSPFLHNNVINENRFNALYMPFLVKPQELKGFCSAAKALGFSGFNATMPHKQALLNIVDELDSEAEAYGAVNTVKIHADGKMTGHNTDVRGLLMALKGQGVQLEGARVMVIGAGGVAGAFVKGCDVEKVAKVTVLNRTYEKAEQLCDGLDYANALKLGADNLVETAGGADIIVNCTSLGMAETGSDFDDLSFLDKTDALLCDLIYNPWETKFLAYGRSRGLKTINGMDMLIYQGLIAFEIFMDVSLDHKKEHDRILPLCRERVFG